MTDSSVLDWLTAYRHTDSVQTERAMLVIAGSQSDCLKRVQAVIAPLIDSMSIHWLGDNSVCSINTTPISLYRALLGREFDIGIYNAHHHFNPNALLALAGTITRGGRLIVLCPTLNVWPDIAKTQHQHFLSFGYQLDKSHYISLFTGMLRQSAGKEVGLWEDQTLCLPTITPQPKLLQRSLFLSDDQARAFDSVIKAWSTTQAFVIDAPRGRGKSALLGFIARWCLNNGLNVLVTSPVNENIEPIINHCKEANHINAQSEHATTRLIHATNQAQLKWVAPDSKLFESDRNEVVVIDEAAALPLPVLKRIASKATRLLLSSTTEGYEGSGQGFKTRFIPWLSTRVTACMINLNQPIRFLPDDPVEAFLNRAMLFDYTLNTLISSQQSLSFQWCQLSSLPHDTLAQTICLLRLAHYQTTPNDILRIIDAPDVLCLIAYKGEQVVAACVINSEGGTRLKEVAEQSACGRRRVKGHLGAQRLGFVMRDAALITANFWRINRIAVLPEHQANSIGTKMITEIRNRARENGIDALISSYGTTARLDRFWLKQGFYEAAKGNKKDKASGRVSKLVCLSLSELFHPFETHIKRVYYYDQHADIGLKNQIEYDNASFQLGIGRLQDFVDGTRQFSQLGFAWLMCQSHTQDVDSKISRIRINHSNQELSAILGVTNKKQIDIALKNIAKQSLDRLKTP